MNSVTIRNEKVTYFWGTLLYSGSLELSFQGLEAVWRCWLGRYLVCFRPVADSSYDRSRIIHLLAEDSLGK